MSEENVEVVRRFIGDTDLAVVLRDEQAWEARLKEAGLRFTPDFEFVAITPAGAIGGRGPENYRARMLDWAEPWDTYTPAIEKLYDLGDRVVVIGQDRGKPRGSEIEVEGPKGLVLYSFDAGKVSRIELYFDREQGLKAAGLERET